MPTYRKVYLFPSEVCGSCKGPFTPPTDLPGHVVSKAHQDLLQPNEDTGYSGHLVGFQRPGQDWPVCHDCMAKDGVSLKDKPSLSKGGNLQVQGKEHRLLVIDGDAP